MPTISTRKARVQINGTTMLATRWTCEVKADEIDVTTFESGGFAEFIPSYVEANYSVDAFWDPAVNVFLGNPPLVAAGSIATNLTLYMKRDAVDGNPVQAFIFPFAYIMTCSVETATRDALRYNFSGRNYGAFSYPGGVVFSGIN